MDLGFVHIVKRLFARKKTAALTVVLPVTLGASEVTEISVGGHIGQAQGSLEAVLRTSDGKVKARRHETADFSVSQDLKGEKRREVVRDHGLWGGRLKNERELATAARYVQTRNAKFGSRFKEPFASADVTWDAISEEEGAENNRLLIQVVVSDVDEKTWTVLSGKGEVCRNDKGEVDVHKRLRDAIARKAQKYDSVTKNKTVLLLEGWPGVMRDELESFRTMYAQRLRQTGFQEIWFVGPNDCPVEQLL